MNDAKYVSKPWGHELWISDGTVMPYALKRILFKAGNQTSLQVHKFKYETNYVLEGTGILLISHIWFDVDKFVDKTMSPAVLAGHIDSMQQIELQPGTIFHVTPCHLHRVIAKSDLVFMEASSRELDDVVRIKDDWARSDGKIDKEHK